MKKSKSLSFVGEQKKKDKKIKSFVIAFSIFVVLLGSVSVLMFMKHLNFDFKRMPSSAQTTTEESTESTTGPVNYEGITRVLLMCGDNNGQLDYVLLITTDYEKGEMTVTPVDRNVQTSFNGLTGNLCDHYKNGGAVAVRGAALNLLPEGADRYIRFTSSQLRSFLHKFEDVVVNVENDIDDAQNGLILNKGKQSLSSELFLKYMNYADDYHKADAFAQFLKILFSERHSVKLADLFSYVANNSQTDVTIVDFKAHEERLTAFSNTGGRVYALEGFAKPDGE